MPSIHRCLIQICAVAWLGAACLAEEAAGSDEACKTRLAILHEALTAWKRKHGDYPLHLGLLLRDSFITDERLLVCPSLEKDLFYRSAGPGILTSTLSDAGATYEYEMDERALMSLRATRGMADASRRAWRNDLTKTALAHVFPIVRCQRHKKHWNVTADGRIYPSGLHWEYEFVDLLPEIYAMPYLARTRSPSIHAHVAPRPSRLGPDSIDLKDAANALPGDPWLDGFKDGDSLEDLAAASQDGYETPDGILFDCRYLVQVCGAVGDEELWKERKIFGGPSYPPVSRGIPIQCKRGDRIHIIHACAYRDRLQSMAGEIVLEDETGKELQKKTLIYGRDTAVWRAGKFLKPAVLVPVWSGKAGKALEKQTGVSGWDARLFLLTWEVEADAAPEKTLFLRLHANPATPASPFIVAVTLSHPS